MRVSTEQFMALIRNRISEERCMIIKELCEKLQDVIWRNTIVDAMRNYTDHKLEHSYRVLKRALEMTDNAMKCSEQFRKLSEDEISILCFAALLHDICMSAHPKMEMDRNIMNYFEPIYRPNINYQEYPQDPSCYTNEQQNEIRTYHAYFAIAKIKLALEENEHNLHEVICKIPEELLEYIFTVIRFHSREPLSQIPSAIKQDKIADVRVPFTTLLFRLADELDLGEDRDIEAARRQGMPAKSRAYWELDYRMTVFINKSNYIDIKFCANKEDIKNYKELFKKLIESHINKNEELVSRLHENHLIIRYNKYNEYTKIDERKESLSYSIIGELKKICNYDKSDLEADNKRIAFLEMNSMDGFKLTKNYMGIIMPYVGDIYKLYVYKEFKLLKENDSIKCKVHINKNNINSNLILSKEAIKLQAYISYKTGSSDFKEFIRCDLIDEISKGEEYLQFRLHFYKYQHGTKVKLPINVGDTIAIFYTYQVYCACYGNELVRKTSVFTDSALSCEIVYPEKNEKLYDFCFYEREDNKQATLLDDLEECMGHRNTSVLYQIQKEHNFKNILDDYFRETNNTYLQIDYAKWVFIHKRNYEHIYQFVANWNFVPFFTDPDIYLNMERYLNDGSPSGFTQKNNTTEAYNPFSKCSEFRVCGFSIKENNIKCIDYGEMPDWIINDEIIIHPDYEGCFRTYKRSSERMVVPTASSRTVYSIDEKCYLKLQYNRKLGRLERFFTPEKICNAIKISAILKEKFDMGIMPEDIFFMPETFGRIIDFGDDFEKHLETRYWGMIVRDILPYPLLDKCEKRLIPAFSMFSNNYKENSTKSIIELLYDFRVQKDMNPKDFFMEKIIKPALKLYFEILLNTGFHIEAHAQNILYLLTVEGNTIDIKGAVIRDFESFDKDLNIMRRLGINLRFDAITEKVNDASDIQRYMRRNSFLFDFKFGEYFLSPLLEYCRKKFPQINVDMMVQEIKLFNTSYIEKLPEDFFPKDKWFSYDKVEFDRSTDERPWIINDELPKYR
ncbi:MAG: hypothetical protein HDR09_02960 [Lachnospiraceae bacterium]|nr:hypothetical protein [Lachnospiraceae bacterium]